MVVDPSLSTLCTALPFSRTAPREALLYKESQANSDFIILMCKTLPRLCGDIFATEQLVMLYFSFLLYLYVLCGHACPILLM